MNHEDYLSCAVTFNKEQRSTLLSDHKNYELSITSSRCKTITIRDNLFKNNKCTIKSDRSGIGFTSKISTSKHNQPKPKWEPFISKLNFLVADSLITGTKARWAKMAFLDFLRTCTRSHSLTTSLTLILHMKDLTWLISIMEKTSKSRIFR